jgi:REP element-mobilizing transposase RayT
MTTSIAGPLSKFSFVGMQYYSLTWRCFERQEHFTQRDRYELVWQQFLRASAETNVANVVHCFMPDHVHQLVKGLTAEADAKDYIKRAKQYGGYYFKKAFRAELWERDGHNHVILGDREVNAQARYIIQNPVRAGLVQRPEDYPFTGSQIYTAHQLMEWVYGDAWRPAT